MMQALALGSPGEARGEDTRPGDVRFADDAATEERTQQAGSPVRQNGGVRFARKPPKETEPVSSLDDPGPFMTTNMMSTPKVTSNPFREAAHRRADMDCVAPQASSVQRPDHEDALRRVAAVVHRHIEMCERRRELAMRSAPDTMETGEFHTSAMELFSEANYASPQYKMRFVRLPLGRPGAVYAMTQVEQTYNRPSAHEIYDFISVLFNSARLSSECSIVCLIYVERLMEKGNVPLTSETWRPVLLCGLLLSHKVRRRTVSAHAQCQQLVVINTGILAAAQLGATRATRMRESSK